MSTPLPPVPGPPPKRGGAWKLLVLFAIIASGFVAFRFTPLAKYAKLSVLQAQLEAFRVHWWAGPVYSLLYAAGCLVGFPGTIVTVLSGLAFGPWWGIVWAVVGSNIGVNAAFWVARLLGKGWLDEKLKGGKLDALNESLAKNGLLRVIQLRLIPAVPFNFLNFACGLTKVRWRDYALGSLIGMLPGTAAYVYFSGVVAQALLSGDSTPEAKRAKWIALGSGLVLLVLVSLIPLIARKLKRTPKPGPAQS
ncbi:MAG: TVP38/TMEM64 family protein [Planctomycetes bacterium]|nr:TVP38/TMEM64 family protein [Planctomycetota bacterium]